MDAFQGEVEGEMGGITQSTEVRSSGVESTLRQYPQIHPGFKKLDSSLLMQLRTQHVPLNSYLHRFKRVDTPHCTACIKNNRIWVRETLNHFLFECSTWRPQRSQW